MMSSDNFSEEYTNLTKRFIGFVDYNLGNEHPKFIQYCFRQMTMFLNKDNPADDNGWSILKTYILYYEEVLQSVVNTIVLLEDEKIETTVSFINAALLKLDHMAGVIPQSPLPTELLRL
jgi:hypothetical protein